MTIFLPSKKQSSLTPFRERDTKANREKTCRGPHPSLMVRVIESYEHACGLNSDLCLHRPQYSSGRHDAARGPGFMSQRCNFQLSDLNVLGCQEIIPPLQGWWSSWGPGPLLRCLWSENYTPELSKIQIDLVPFSKPHLRVQWGNKMSNSPGTSSAALGKNRVTCTLRRDEGFPGSLNGICKRPALEPELPM